MSAHLVLQSWKQIADYVGRTARTLQRWEREYGFPVHRPAGKSRSAVMALAKEIQEWTRGKPSLVQIRRAPRLNRAELLAATPRHNHNSGIRETPSSLLPLPSLPSIARACHDLGTNVVVEHQRISRLLLKRARVSASLRNKQKKLRRDLKDLLAQQRRLRKQLRNGLGAGQIAGLRKTAGNVQSLS